MTHKSSAESDRGQRRKANEDSILAPVTITWPGAEQCTLFAVADGVGGAVGGAVASATAVKHFRESFTTLTIADPAARLRAAIEVANDAVIAKWVAQPELQGMATTMVSAAILGDRIWFANVGDSRGYLVQAGVLYQVTRDHSLVSDAVRAGLLTPEQAPTRPERHVINRSLGTADAVEIDCFGPLRFSPGDVALVCSDGLHDVVSEDTMFETLQQLSPDEAGPVLVRLANESGGPDNISVVIVGA